MECFISHATYLMKIQLKPFVLRMPLLHTWHDGVRLRIWSTLLYRHNNCIVSFFTPFPPFYNCVSLSHPLTTTLYSSPFCLSNVRIWRKFQGMCSKIGRDSSRVNGNIMSVMLSIVVVFIVVTFPGIVWDICDCGAYGW